MHFWQSVNRYLRVNDTIYYSNKHDTFLALLFVVLDHFKKINDHYGQTDVVHALVGMNLWIFFLFKGITNKNY